MVDDLFLKIMVTSVGELATLLTPKIQTDLWTAMFAPNFRHASL